jgi:hypothetical protein
MGGGGGRQPTALGAPGLSTKEKTEPCTSSAGSAAARPPRRRPRRADRRCEERRAPAPVEKGRGEAGVECTGAPAPLTDARGRRAPVVEHRAAPPAETVASGTQRRQGGGQCGDNARRRGDEASRDGVGEVVDVLVLLELGDGHGHGSGGQEGGDGSRSPCTGHEKGRGREGWREGGARNADPVTAWAGVAGAGRACSGRSGGRRGAGRLQGRPSPNPSGAGSAFSPITSR